MNQSQISRKRTYQLISSYFYAFHIPISFKSRLETSFYSDFESVHTFSLGKKTSSKVKEFTGAEWCIVGSLDLVCTTQANSPTESWHTAAYWH